MAGGHAQVMSAVEVSLALRVADTTRTDVAAALWEERSLVKTFGPRGTVHVLPAADLPWWLAALGSVPTSGGHPEGVRLLPDETDAIVAALDAALREEDRTTEELDAYVAEACGPWAAEESMAAFGGFWPRWRLALGPAAVRGVLCFGPNRGRKVAYASPSRWLSDLALPDPAEAQLELLRAYLTAYGPATPAHLARWLATSPTWTSELFERADLEEVELDGETAWVLRGDTAFDAPEPPAVRLLPYFDAFQVGSQPRALLFPGRASERALAGAQAGNFPVAAARRRGGWGLAPETVRQAVGRHRRAAGQTDEQAACRSRRAGGPDRRDRRGHARVDGWAGDGGPARVALPACPTASTTAR